jgi:hypothetical protein
VEIDSPDNKRKRKYFSIIGVVIACAAILFGLHFFINDREIRVVQSKYENGTDKEIWVYKKSFFGKKKKILELTYYSDGSKESERHYKKGKVNGWARMWYKSGQLQLEGTYKNSRPHGIRTAYHENGQPFCRAKYENGKLIEKENWDENGNKIYLPLDRD